MEMTAVQKNQTIKEMSSQFTWTNPVMEVKIEKKNCVWLCYQNNFDAWLQFLLLE